MTTGVVAPVDASELGSFPRYAIGVLSPIAGADTMPHGFYRLLGPDFIVLSTSLALASFQPEDLDRAVAAIDEKLNHLLSRGANLIIQSGTPLALSLGPEGHARLIERLRQRAGVPVISSALNAVDAARALGVKRLVVANKWNERINRQLTDFFAHWETRSSPALPTRRSRRISRAPTCARARNLPIGSAARRSKALRPLTRSSSAAAPGWSNRRRTASSESSASP
jgi:maleate cis-trans isomerase